MLSIGATIRDYRIVEILGEGGMGIVYLAEDVMLDRQVAIKTLNIELAQDDQLINRFRHEAKMQASLIHPNIVALYNFFQEDEAYCMVLEYAPGRSLKVLLKQEGRLAETRALSMFAQMLRAVDYAHGRKIIHRDLKPGNIMVDDQDMIKVMDFGIARILGDKGLTRTGARMGTVIYMSPEQVRAEKDIDHRTDIYSLGITLYEMLTGNVPYATDTESDFELMQQIVGREMADPREFNPNLSQATVNLLSNCMAKNREERFPDCDVILHFMQTAPPAAGRTREAAVAATPVPPGAESDGKASKRVQEAGVSSVTRTPARSESALSTAPDGAFPSSRHRVTWRVALVILAVLLGSAIFWAVTRGQKDEDRALHADNFDASTIRPAGSDGDPAATEARVVDFVKKVISLANARDISGLLECYADPANYFSKGLVNKGFIRQDKINYYRGFDRVRFWLDGEITQYPAAEAGVRIAQFRMGFQSIAAKEN